jgi:F420-non-reducing hydrogenase iron-sulfur subunit
MNDFEPQIIAFLCNWCAYTGVDLSSGTRAEYPPNVKIIRMMCSGAVDPLYVIKTLLDGADGVLIGGCHLGDCHYQSGNYKARQQVDILRSILGQVGLDEDRVWVRWFSAAEGPLFANAVTEMVEHLKEKGPSPLKELWAI